LKEYACRIKAMEESRKETISNLTIGKKMKTLKKRTIKRKVRETMEEL
jgi:hypothetical protein